MPAQPLNSDGSHTPAQRLTAARVRGHHSDFDDLSWHLTYRAMAAAQDVELPQSEAESQFVEQMLRVEAALAVLPFEASRLAAQHSAEPRLGHFAGEIPYAQKPAATAPTPLVASVQQPQRKVRKVMVWALAVVAILFFPTLLSTLFRASSVAAPTTSVDWTPPPATSAPPPAALVDPPNKSAAEVLSEMLAIAEDANPGIMWFSTTEPSLRGCILGYQQEGLAGYLNVQWGMGDFDAIPTDNMVEANNEWRRIQRENDIADDRMIAAWAGIESLDETAHIRYSIEPFRGNWSFGSVYPGLAAGAIFFDLETGVGTLLLETQCLPNY